MVRYLTGDPPEMAEAAAHVIDKEEGLRVKDVMVAETAPVLTSVYKVPREVVVDHLVALLQKENISVFALDKGFALQALLLCKPSGRISFADGVMWAAARSAGRGVVYSLDKRFPGDGLQIQPGRQK